MSKKNEASDFNTPDYDSFSTIDEVEKEIERREQILIGKDKLQARIKEEKKDFCSAINEQLKEVEEERLHEIGVLSGLEQRKQYLANGGGVVIPITSKGSN